MPDSSAGKRSTGDKPDIGGRELIFIHFGEAGSQVGTSVYNFLGVLTDNLYGFLARFPGFSNNFDDL